MVSEEELSKKLLTGNCIDVVSVRDKTDGSIQCTPFFVRFPKKSKQDQTVEVYVKSFEPSTDLTAELYKSSKKNDPASKSSDEVLVMSMALESGFQIPFFDQGLLGRKKISDLMTQFASVEEDDEEDVAIRQQDLQSSLEHDLVELIDDSDASEIVEKYKKMTSSSSPMPSAEFELFKASSEEEMKEFYTTYNSLTDPKEKIKFLKESTKKRREERQEQDDLSKKKELLMAMAGDFAMNSVASSNEDSGEDLSHTPEDVPSPIETKKEGGFRQKLSHLKQKFKRTPGTNTPSQDETKSPSSPTGKRDKIKNRILKSIHDELLYPHEWFLPTTSHKKNIEQVLSKFYERGETKLTLIFKTKAPEKVKSAPEVSMFGSNIAALAGAKKSKKESK